MELNFEERRVLGVLLEKSYATPNQYPLTLNSLVTGCNQKSCRIPVTHFGEEEVLDALAGLKKKGLAVTTQTTGSYTERFRHIATEHFGIEGRVAAVLAELLLRGPQTDGELRQRANRLVKIADLDVLADSIGRLIDHPEKLARRLSPEGRKRGVKYAHCLSPAGEAPDLEEDTGEEEPAPRRSAPVAPSGPNPELVALKGEVEELRATVASLEEKVDRLEMKLDQVTS